MQLYIHINKCFNVHVCAGRLGMAERFTQTFLMYVPEDQTGIEFRILQVRTRTQNSCVCTCVYGLGLPLGRFLRF